MTEVEAVYQNGVFKPLSAVPLEENQRVHLSVRPVDVAETLAWLDDMQERHRRIVESRGYFPDSTPDIAEDRRRGV
jgi:predicted DNA-binding antitoxin AbrB/MazE fold protein